MRREPSSSLESVEEGSDREDRGEQSGTNKHGSVTNELVESRGDGMDAEAAETNGHGNLPRYGGLGLEAAPALAWLVHQSTEACLGYV